MIGTFNLYNFYKLLIWKSKSTKEVLLILEKTEEELIKKYNVQKNNIFGMTIYEKYSGVYIHLKMNKNKQKTGCQMGSLFFV